MSNLTFTRRSVLSLGMFCAASACTGCNVVLGLGYLIGGPPMSDPDFHKSTRKFLEDSKKPTVIVCYAPEDIRLEHPAADYELSRYVAMQLSQNKIKCVDPDKVRAWMDKNPNWSHPYEIGEYFQAGFVVHIDLRAYSLLEENSAHLYRGRSDLVVSVWEMNENGKGKEIYNHPHRSQFPLAAPVSADTFPLNDFKLRYLTRLSAEIGQLFYPVPTGEEIPNRAIGMLWLAAAARR